MPTKTIRIDGMKFTHYKTYYYKTEARRKATELRYKGKHARIIKSTDGRYWHVYILAILAQKQKLKKWQKGGGKEVITLE